MGGGDEETIAFNAVMGDAIPAAKAGVTRVGGSMAPDDAIEEYKKRQAIEEIEDQKEDEEIAEMFMGGIMDYFTGDDDEEEDSPFVPSSRRDARGSKTNKGISSLQEDATSGEPDPNSEGDTKKLTKEEKANKVADGLAALAEGMGGMGGGQMSRGEMGVPIGASVVPFTRVGMAEGGIMQMANGGMSDEQARSRREMLALIDASPLSAADKAVQKQLINLQIGQQTLPVSYTHLTLQTICSV